MSITDEQLSKQLPIIQGFKPWYRLRWRFQFSDGKPDKYGQWNGSQIAAWSVNKANILYAVIEGEKIGAWSIHEFVRVPGPMYATCKWVAACGVSTKAVGKYGAIQKAGDIVGLTFQTNDEAITVFIDGRIDRRSLTDYERKFKLKEHTGA